MAKKSTTKTPPPTALTMRLGAPGMSPLHRAGLGGLAATLRVLDAMKKENPDDYPFTAPLWREEWCEQKLWEVTKTDVTIHFGEPQNAALFLEWLFQFAFGLQDGLIFLPGQYKVGNSPPPVEVRARLQDGITQTFLQHVQHKNLDQKQPYSYPLNSQQVSFYASKCSCYYPNQVEKKTRTNKAAWEDWCKNDGSLKNTPFSISGQIYPGAMVRHSASKYAAATQIAQPVELVLPLQFALVGTLSLPLSGNRGVLIVPHIDDLLAFAKYRWRVTPKTYQQTQVTCISDAALQFEIRRRGEMVQSELGDTGCDATLFRKTPGSKDQKFRADVCSVEKIDGETLDFYSRVLAYLRPHIKEAKESVKEGRGKNAVTTEVIKRFWSDPPVVRSFIADNLAQGKHWFIGFARWMNTLDPAYKEKKEKKRFYETISFNKEGFQQMIRNDKLDWKLEGARPLVLAVQESLRCLYGKAGGLGKQLGSEYDKWRLAFSGAKTAERFRYVLSDMFSRAKFVPSLQGDWESVTKLLLTDWEAARDLALIGLASYKGKEKEATATNDEEAVDSD